MTSVFSTPESAGNNDARQISPGDAGVDHHPNSSTASSAVADDTARGLGDLLLKGIFIQAGAGRNQSGYSAAQVNGMVERAVGKAVDGYEAALREARGKARAAEAEVTELTELTTAKLNVQYQRIVMLCFFLFQVIVCGSFYTYFIVVCKQLLTDLCPSFCACTVIIESMQ